VVLSELEELPDHEIAEVLGISLEAPDQRRVGMFCERPDPLARLHAVYTHKNGHLGVATEAPVFIWWAVKDSNLGPAD
jgi:hypothetical protein